MKLLFNREMGAFIMIIGAVCVGGWMLLVEPRLQQLAEIEAGVANAEAAVKSTALATDVQLRDRIRRVQMRISEIEAGNEPAHDQALLYRRLTALAEANGVLIHNVRPSPAPRARDADDRVSVTQIQVSFEGGYSEVAAFVNQIETIEGFIRPVRLELSPTGRAGEDRVSGNAIYEALSITIPENLLALRGSSDETR